MQPGTVIANRFQILHLGGVGGMGSVYKALDLNDGRTVAVKVARPSEDHQHCKRSVREVQTLAGLRHPGIVDYVAHGFTENGQPFLVMEWLDGYELSLRIRESKLSEAETLSVGLQVASALAICHADHVVHRDIKPENLFLVGGKIDQIKLIDFGIARPTCDATMITRSGVMLGTPNFMAPEQLGGEQPVDGQADLYSLGAVLFACLTGRPLFVGNHVMAVLTKIRFEEAPRVRHFEPEILPALDEVIASLLAKNPQVRPDSADRVVESLRHIRDCDDRHNDHVPQSTSLSSERPAIAVSDDELRYVSVLLVGHEALQEPSAIGNTLGELARARDVMLERLSRDTVAAVFTRAEDAGETATHAARFALAVRRQYPEAPIVVATGRGVLGRRLPVGEAVDRAVALLVDHDTRVLDSSEDARKARSVLIDELTAALLDRRFHIERDRRARLTMTAENATPRAARKVLGQTTPCVGRKRELMAMATAFHECVLESVAQALLFIGPAGSGKSRLAGEAVKQFRAADSRPCVFLARGDSMRAGSPFGMLGQLVRSAMNLDSSDSVERQRQTITAHVAELLQEASRPPGHWARYDSGRHSLPGLRADLASDTERLAVFLGELAGVAFPDTGHLQLGEARSDARLMHDQLRRAWHDWLDTQTQRHPVILVLDDLHWGDLPTTRFIDAALREFSERPLMVLALARPEVNRVFPDLWGMRGIHRIALRPLSKRACTAIAQQVLPDGVARDVVDRLVTRSAGNPFCLEELVRSAAAGQFDDLPDTILAMVGARLHALPDSERRVLRAASVFGREFWLGGVAALLGESPGSLAGIAGRLVEQEFIVELPNSRFAGQRAYAVAHDLTGEAAYATLPDDDRVRAHARAGQWLENVGESDPVILAEHYHKGEAPERAFTWFSRAAEQALAASHLNATIEYAERAVSLAAHREGLDTELGRLRLLQAEAHNWSSQYNTARTRAREAMERLPAGTSDWARAAEQTGWASSVLGNTTVLHEIAQELMDFAPPELDSVYVSSAVSCATWLLYYGAASTSQALKELVEARTESNRGSPRIAAAIAELDGVAASLANDWYRAAMCFQNSTDAWNEVGDQRRVCLAESNLGVMLRELGQYERASRVLRRAIDHAERLELSFFIALYELDLVISLARSGHVDEAEASLTSIGPVEDPRQEVSNSIYKAQIALFGHQFARALDRIDRTLESIDKVQVRGVWAYAQAVRAQALLAVERPQEALAAAQLGMDQLDKGIMMEEGEALLRLVHAEALHACGQRDRAKQAIKVARDRLLGRAELVRNAEWRTDFLNRVVENRRTIELSRAWLNSVEAPEEVAGS